MKQCRASANVYIPEGSNARTNAAPLAFTPSSKLLLTINKPQKSTHTSVEATNIRSTYEREVAPDDPIAGHDGSHCCNLLHRL